MAAARRRIIAAAPGLARDLPWRGASPWGVLVSEVMLQQTPVGRVREPWHRFMDSFPTPTACADASRADVLRAWGTLGYPRRAVSLHRTSALIVERHGGDVPTELDDLIALPGVGAYTARAVCVFAFGLPEGVVDVNAHRVLSRFVAGAELSRADAQALADRLVDRAAPAQFTQAVLDLGAQHCRAEPRCQVCPLSRVCAWRRHGGPDPAEVRPAQSPFVGSVRQARGRLLAALRAGPQSLSRSLALVGGANPLRVVDAMTEEGLVSIHHGTVWIGERERTGPEL